MQPSRDVFAEMMAQVPKLGSHDGGDTGFLNSFFPSWYEWSSQHRLPFRYNALRTMYWFTHKNPGYWEAIKPIKILHFCSSPKFGGERQGQGSKEASLISKRFPRTSQECLRRGRVSLVSGPFFSQNQAIGTAHDPQKIRGKSASGAQAVPVGMGIGGTMRGLRKAAPLWPWPLLVAAKKPWDAQAKKGDLEQVWWEHYLRSQMAF
ncbi:unnamed protein product [Prorocentrum cordatum]|uniref:Uncharacterized protein n=1 Tax=Prorocentrum cordatum TaxID=2364126 RepID=A0ABN9UJR1_9DINO|nr:unnamed protein product [Polarella glacialis]